LKTGLSVGIGAAVAAVGIGIAVALDKDEAPQARPQSLVADVKETMTWHGVDSSRGVAAARLAAAGVQAGRSGAEMARAYNSFDEVLWGGKPNIREAGAVAAVTIAALGAGASPAQVEKDATAITDAMAYRGLDSSRNTAAALLITHGLETGRTGAEMVQAYNAVDRAQGAELGNAEAIATVAISTR